MVLFLDVVSLVWDLAMIRAFLMIQRLKEGLLGVVAGQGDTFL